VTLGGLQAGTAATPADGRAAKLAARGLSKVFLAGSAPVTALAHADFEVSEGEFLVIVGPSGCGKTTLLRMLAGLESPTTGEVHAAGVRPGRPAGSMVFQERSIFPWLTVLDNVAYGLRMRGVDRRSARATAREYVDKVGLSGFADAHPHQLSGGMKQRVSIARAFANDPDVLLMDEPFASLDEQTKVLIQGELLRIWEASRKTVVYVTHSIDEALVMGDRIMVMTARPGRIKAIMPVRFPRPRAVMELKSSPEFGRLSLELWELLRDEVLRSAETPAPEGPAA
jgi:NitT/TauT family transport system ATP-binding protein